MNNDNIYSKKEISKILSKATEIQTQKDLYGDKDGLDEKELIALAKEVGIDQNSLLEALEKYDEPDLDKPFQWTKASSKVQQIVTVNGEVNESNWEEVVQEIRKVNGGIGKLHKTGSSFEWEQRMQEIGYKHISFTPQNGKTKIQYVSSWSPLRFLILFMGTFFVSVGVLVFLKGIGLPKNTAILFTPLGAVLGFSTGLLFLKSRFQKEKKRLNKIIDAVSKKVRSINSSANTINIENEDIYDSGVESTSRSRISH